MPAEQVRDGHALHDAADLDCAERLRSRPSKIKIFHKTWKILEDFGYVDLAVAGKILQLPPHTYIYISITIYIYLLSYTYFIIHTYVCVAGRQGGNGKIFHPDTCTKLRIPHYSSKFAHVVGDDFRAWNYGVYGVEGKW